MNQKQLPNANFRVASGVFAFGGTGPPDDEQLMTCKGLQKEGFAQSEAFLAGLGPNPKSKGRSLKAKVLFC